MKRISFFLVILCALILSVGLSTVQAQNGIVDIRAISGLYKTDTLFTGQNLRFVFGINNNTGHKMNISNGFVFASPDGALWDSISVDSCGPNSGGLSKLAPFFLATATFFEYTPGSPFPLDGPNGPGHIAFLGGANNKNGGLPIGYSDTVYTAVVWMPPSTLNPNNGKHICVDSQFTQPGNTWVWVDPNSLLNYYPTFVDNMAGAPAFASTGGGFCFVMYKVPNQRPVVMNTATVCDTAHFPPATFVDPTLTGSHCSAFTYAFKACDKESDPYTFQKVSGPGSIDANTGVWSASGLATGPYTVVVTASDAGGAGTPVSMSVNVTNGVPTIAGDCGNTITTSSNTNTNAQFTSTDADACDPKNWTIISIAPPTGATASIDGTGKVTFNATVAPQDYVVTVGVSDGIVANPTTCSVTFHVLAGSLYGIVIAKNEKVLQGGFSGVDVTLKGYDPALGLGGFDLLIAYDNSALSLQNVTTGALYADCKWEYFTFRFGANGNCSGGCPSGLVRIVGLAETNNGANHPTCYGPPHVPEQMFTLNFLVSNNRTFACSYVPIRFFWIDCSDNTLSSQDGSRLIIAKNVYDFHNQLQPISDSFATFPGYAGDPIGVCGELDTLHAGKYPPKRDIDFFDGGIDIVCAESIDARGDINLNGVPNEIADVVMFTNYFIYGLGAFGTHIQGSIAASDVNADGNALTVADLVYLIRIVVGDALPYPKTSPAAVSAGYTNNLGSLSVDQPMAAAYVIARGNVTPTLLASGMKMDYAFDGKNTHILVYPPYQNASSIKTFTGNFLNAGGDVVSIDLSTAEGAQVVAKAVPANFGLKQNYPNPFNPTTNISFDLPKASQYTLTIYNVTGQSVAEFSGAAEAGTKTISWNASNNASGIYFYKLSAGSFSATKKMVLLK